MTNHTPLTRSQALIQQRSISDTKDEGAISLLERWLNELGFTCHRIPCQGEAGVIVDNLYAQRGNVGKNLCFAGHTDVVPVGDSNQWSVDPFSATIQSINGEDYLIGRGASDMKAAIACMVAGIESFLAAYPNFTETLSLMIAGDEETGGKGTQAMLAWLKEHNITLDGCIVGEPTNPTALGQMIKIGRRGSLSFKLTVHGKQGHVAYPDTADNPITTLMKMLYVLKQQPLDAGTEFFPPSNLEVVTLNVQNNAMNVIPAEASACFNVRFNPTYTRDSLEAWIITHCNAIGKHYTLTRLELGSEAFLTEKGKLSTVVQHAVASIVGITPELGTTGGTSDARFIKDACPVVECGLDNQTAHQVDEKVRVKEIEQLTRIYQKVLEEYFFPS